MRVPDKSPPHTEVDATYSIIREDDGTKFLQVDTYGSASRKIPGKVSQSIRFSPEALKQLRKILKDHFDIG